MTPSNSRRCTAANYTHLAAVHVSAHVEELTTIGPTTPTVASLDEARKRRMEIEGIRNKKRADEAAATSGTS